MSTRKSTVLAAVAASVVVMTVATSPVASASDLYPEALLLPPVAGYDSTGVTDLNDHGVIVGYATLPRLLSPARPIRWDLHGTATDLGGLGGIYGSAQAVNEHGEIAGWSELPDGAGPHAVRWDSQGRIHDLGVYPGDSASVALAINDDGTIVGSSSGQDGSRAVRWDRAGRITALEKPPNTSQAWGTALNNRGETAGTLVDSGTGTTHAARWDAAGRVQVLPNRGGDRDEVSGIADDGTVAGTLFSNFEHTMAVRWDRAGRLNPLSTEAGSVAAIARNGVIVGGTETGQKLWDLRHNRTLPLRSLTNGGLDAIVRDVNEHSAAVGYCTSPSGTGLTAVRWTKAGRPVQLRPPTGHTETSALKINNRGVVVGGLSDSYPGRGVVWPRT